MFRAIITLRGGTNQFDLRYSPAERIHRQRPEALQHEAPAERASSRAERARALREAEREAPTTQETPHLATVVVRPIRCMSHTGLQKPSQLPNYLAGGAERPGLASFGRTLRSATGAFRR